MTKQKTIAFTKMSGAGNDFLIVAAQKGMNYSNLAQAMCDRTNGVGADGLLVLDASRQADYRMRIINADGSEAEMCGNGVRCLGAYILARRHPSKKNFSIETLAGLIRIRQKGKAMSVRLSDPKDYKSDMPLAVGDRATTVHFMNTGVPHTIVFVNGLADIDVQTIGRAIRYHEAFAPKGTNVNFVEQVKPGFIAVRTYERGVEGETKACGTGSVASAIIAFLKSRSSDEDVRQVRQDVLTKSGDVLTVTFDVAGDQVMNVWLTGAVRFIADGKFFVAK